MTTVASFRNPKNETICTKCGEALIAPEWSEYVSEQLVRNLWSCTNCDYRFETEVAVPADTHGTKHRSAVEAFFSSLLVA